MKTLFIHKSTDLQLTARFEDSTEVLSIQGNWKQQEFGMSIPAKVEQQTTPFEKLLDLAERAQASADIVQIQLTPYQSDLIALSEQCRKGEIDTIAFSKKVLDISHKYELLTTHVITDLFAC